MDNKILQFIDSLDPLTFGAGIVGIVLFFILLGLLLYRHKHPSDEKLIDATVKELGIAHHKNVIISDGVYGYHFIDYMILFPEMVMLLGVQHYEGYIFGADNIDEWAQVSSSKKSYKFRNPLQDYQTCAQTISSLIEGANIIARMVFTSSSEFPKGVPASVYQMDNFKSELVKLVRGKPLDAKNQAVWDQLIVLTNEHKRQYQKEKAQSGI